MREAGLPQRPLDLPNEQIGAFIVMEHALKRSRGEMKPHWRCRCSTCGVEKLFADGTLRRMAPRCVSCRGMTRWPLHLSNRRVGTFELLERTYKSAHGGSKLRWRCRCSDCGAESFYADSTLRYC